MLMHRAVFPLCRGPGRGRRGTDAGGVLFCHTTAPSTVLLPRPGPVAPAVVSGPLGTQGPVTSVLAGKRSGHVLQERELSVSDQLKPKLIKMFVVLFVLVSISCLQPNLACKKIRKASQTSHSRTKTNSVPHPQISQVVPKATGHVRSNTRQIS